MQIIKSMLERNPAHIFHLYYLASQYLNWYPDSTQTVGHAIHLWRFQITVVSDGEEGEEHDQKRQVPVWFQIPPAQTSLFSLPFPSPHLELLAGLGKVSSLQLSAAQQQTEASCTGEDKTMKNDHSNGTTSRTEKQ